MDPLTWPCKSVGDQLEPTYSSSVRIRDVALRTCQKRSTIGRSGERGSGKSLLVARQDDDDDENGFKCCYLILVILFIKYSYRIKYWSLLYRRIAIMVRVFATGPFNLRLIRTKGSKQYLMPS